MKFIIYNGQNKFIIDNASIPEEEYLEPDGLDSNYIKSTLYDFCITAETAEKEDALYDDELIRTTSEGILWKQETIH